eukprot:5502662-Heterocapsa_arctica.AAC.1
MKTRQCAEPRTQDNRRVGNETATRSPTYLSGRGARTASWAEHLTILMRPARPMRSADSTRSQWNTGSCRARARMDRGPSWC